MYARLEMPVGTPFEKTLDVIKQLETAADEAKEDFTSRSKTGKVYEHVFSIIGQQPGIRRGPHRSGGSTINPAIAEINIELVDPEVRKFSTTEVMNKWREIAGDIPGVKSLVFQSSIMSAGNDIEIQLSSSDSEELNRAVNWVKKTCFGI